MNARSLFTAASHLAPGAIVSVGRPNSLFQACVSILNRPASDHLRHASTALLAASEPLAALARQGWPHVGYRKQIVAERNGRLLLANGQIVDQVTLDAFYGHLRTCVAIEVDAQSWACLRGAGGLIQRHRPMLVIERSREAAPRVAALLDEFDYVVADAAGDAAEGGIAPPSNHVLAFPKSRAAGLAQGGQVASLYGLLVKRGRDFELDPLSGWSCALTAADVCLLPGVLELRGSQALRWTGPERTSRLFIWAPAEGLYRLTVDVAELAYPADLGIGTLTRPLDKRKSVAAQGSIELTMSITRAESRDALPVAFTTLEPWRRLIAGRECKVGAAISRLRVRRLGALSLPIMSE